MAYFYVSRRKAPMPFVNQYMTAGVIEADSLDAAKEQFRKVIQPAVGKGVECAEAFEILALDEAPRGDHGMVAGSFIGQD